VQSSIDTLAASELPIDDLRLAAAGVVVTFTSPLCLFTDLDVNLRVQ
jgi:hypothetical protein